MRTYEQDLPSTTDNLKLELIEQIKILLSYKMYFEFNGREYFVLRNGKKEIYSNEVPEEVGNLIAGLILSELVKKHCNPNLKNKELIETLYYENDLLQRQLGEYIKIIPKQEISSHPDRFFKSPAMKIVSLSEIIFVQPLGQIHLEKFNLEKKALEMVSQDFSQKYDALLKRACSDSINILRTQFKNKTFTLKIENQVITLEKNGKEPNEKEKQIFTNLVKAKLRPYKLQLSLKEKKLEIVGRDYSYSKPTAKL